MRHSSTWAMVYSTTGEMFANGGDPLNPFEDLGYIRFWNLKHF